MNRKVAAEIDQPVHIPSVETVITGPEVILLPHNHSVAQAVPIYVRFASRLSSS